MPAIGLMSYQLRLIIVNGERNRKGNVFLCSSRMMMRGRKRLRTIAALMILSFLMLAAFTASWLYVQYRTEKNALGKSLSALYDTRLQYYIDKAFGKAFLSGQKFLVTNDSTMVGTPDTFMRYTSQQVIHRKNGLSTTKVMSRDSIMRNSGTLLPQRKSYSDIQVRISSNTTIDNPQSSGAAIGDVLLDSIQIKNAIVNILSGLGKELILLQADTGAFRKDFDTLLHHDYPGVGFHLNPPLAGDWTLVAQSSNKPFWFNIRSYNLFLTRKLIPQLSFCFVLLGLCSCAFLLSFFSLRKQMRLSEQKNDFISNMSHELKTPVTTAQLALEAFNHFDISADPMRTKEYLQIATGEVRRLDLLVANVLNHAQLDEGRIRLHKDMLSLNLLITELISRIKPACIAEGKQLRFAGSGSDIIVRGDRLHLEGALYNVLDNAVKYGRRVIEVSVEERGKVVDITISDDGPGIPLAFREKIFDKFFRIPTGNEHNVKGYGLGLHYSMYIVNAHGGTIHLSATDNGGAQFVITLPQAVCDEN